MQNANLKSESLRNAEPAKFREPKDAEDLKMHNSLGMKVPSNTKSPKKNQESKLIPTPLINHYGAFYITTITIHI